MAGRTILTAKHITKIFPGMKALDDVDFDLREGEVHILVGENGAGKSTLAKCILAAYKADGGEITLDGTPVHWPIVPGHYASEHDGAGDGRGDDAGHVHICADGGNASVVGNRYRSEFIGSRGVAAADREVAEGAVVVRKQIL